jgi:hypothetical protein
LGDALADAFYEFDRRGEFKHRDDGTSCRSRRARARGHILVDMEKVCSQCGAKMVCEPEGGCWCAELPHVVAVPGEGGKGCLCRDCLMEKIARQAIPGVRE